MSTSIMISTSWVKAPAALACGLASSALAYLLASRETIFSRIYGRYIHHLDAALRMLFKPTIGGEIAASQWLLISLLLVAQLAMGLPMPWLAVISIMLGPSIYLRHECRSRVKRLESQVDGFVIALANSLKTVPSPAAALQATSAVLPQPIRQEIEQVLKAMRVGSTIDQGLIAMSLRLKSSWLDVALSAVLIGLRVGGNLPVVLERTAATIREMNRLLGVVRTKTGESRMQLWVLAGFPIFIAFGFNAAQPGYFDPLEHSLVGQLAVGCATILWLGSLLLARKVLDVDL